MKYHALYIIFEKAEKFEICRLLQIIGGALRVIIKKRHPASQPSSFLTRFLFSRRQPCAHHQQNHPETLAYILIV